MSKQKAGRTEGYATLELLEGLRHMNIDATVYNSEKKVHDPEKMIDDPSATRVGKFEYDALPLQTQKLTVHYSHLSETYWKADFDILSDIQAELKIRYPKDHPDKPLAVINPSDIDPTDYYDFFFQQFKLNKLGGDQTMRGGVYTFNCANPVDRLLFYAYMYHPDTEVLGETIDKLHSGRKRWRLIMPEKEKAIKVKETNDKIEVISMLDKKRGIAPEKQRMIAEILEAKIDIKTANDDDIRIALMTQFVDDSKRLPKWDKSSLDVVAYLGDEISTEKLQRIHLLSKAISYNLIVRTGDTFRFNETEIVGVTSYPELYEYFDKKDTHELLRDIKDFVSSRDKQLDGNIG